MSETYYDLLGIDEDVSEEAIEQAYRRLIKETHPDVSDDPHAREQMVELTRARNVLTDPEKRAKYNAQHGVSLDESERINQHGSTTSRTQDRARTHHDHSNHEHSSSDTSTATDTTSSESTRQSRSRHQRTRTTRGQTQTHSPTQTIHSGPLRMRLQYLPSQIGSFTTVALKWFVLLMMEILFLEFLWGINRDRIYSIMTSRTVVRLVAGFGLWWGVLQLSRVLKLGLTSSAAQGLLVIMSLFSSYVGYDLIVRYTAWGENQPQSRFQPHKTVRLWPIVVINLLGIGLGYWGLRTGALFGGFGFAITTIFAFLFFMFLFGWGVLLFSFIVGGELSEFLLENGAFIAAFLGPLLSLIVLFTRYGWKLDSTVAQLLRDTPAAAYPWLGPGLVGRVGPVYGDVILNFGVGILMVAAFAWSLAKMYRDLTKVSWNDRFERGYRIWPGIWNLLIILPLVMCFWMVSLHFYVIQISVGLETFFITVDQLILLLGVSPAVVTGLYILRRQLEPWFQKTVWDR